jgi:hypothetical protein
MRVLRPRAERSGAAGEDLGAGGCDAARSLAFFDPIDQGLQAIPTVCAGAALAMPHTGNEEETGEIWRTRAVLFGEALVIVHHFVAGKDGIGRAVGKEQFVRPCGRGRCRS